MTPADLRAELKCRVSEAGSQRDAARALGISQAQVCLVVTGRRKFSDRMAAKLGYRKVVTFEPLEGQQQAVAAIEAPCFGPRERRVRCCRCGLVE